MVLANVALKARVRWVKEDASVEEARATEGELVKQRPLSRWSMGRSLVEWEKKGGEQGDFISDRWIL